MKVLYTRKTFPNNNARLNTGRLYFALKASSYFLSFLLPGLMLVNVSLAQVGINNFTALSYAPVSGSTYTGPGGGIGAQSEYMPANNNTFTYNFGTTSGLTNGSMRVNGYIAGSTPFSVLQNIITSVKMRRVNNPVISGQRDILFFAGNRTPGIGTPGLVSSALTINLNAMYTPDMSIAFSQNNLFIGTDNIFSNQGNGNGNNNNLERADILIAGGFKVPDAYQYGFPILERGTYGAHDAFKVAVITALDSDGNPSAYSKVLSVTASNYNNTNGTNPVADGTYTYFLFRRDGAANLEVNQHINNQGIGGTAFRFSDFAIASGTTIYGYSIMANDFNSTSGDDVVDYTNTAHFPSNTSETIGGLDLLAVMGIAAETAILPIQLSSFTAREKDGQSLLQWTTATELSNRGFQVERSTNGREWINIGFVSSKANEGNSTQKLEYSFTDKEQLTGVYQYRLKQTDLFNHEMLSDIRFVSFDRSTTATIKIFPNPAVNTLYVQGIEQGVQLNLTNAAGATVSSRYAKATTEILETGQLNPGIYFLQVINNHTVVNTLKVVKQ